MADRTRRMGDRAPVVVVGVSVEVVRGTNLPRLELHDTGRRDPRALCSNRPFRLPMTLTLPLSSTLITPGACPSLEQELDLELCVKERGGVVSPPLFANPHARRDKSTITVHSNRKELFNTILSFIKSTFSALGYTWEAIIQ